MKQQGDARVFSKLNRMMANSSWQDNFTSTKVNFQYEGDFDHSPTLLTVFPGIANGRKPFRYFTMWKGRTHFDGIIRQACLEPIQG